MMIICHRRTGMQPLRQRAPEQSVLRGSESDCCSTAAGKQLRRRWTENFVADQLGAMAKIKKAMKGGSKVSKGKKGKKILESDQARGTCFWQFRRICTLQSAGSDERVCTVQS
eukprot:4239115-Pleurochrysis_carterae.AAC.2